MKILLFTHEQDIDGIGSVLLANTSNLEYDLVLSKTFELDEKIYNKLKEVDYHMYDKIIITDLCPKNDTLKYLEKDKDLFNRFYVLDHHKTSLELNKYACVKVTPEINGKKESGTSLFYKYLVANNLINKTDTLDELVELTRQYDTWDWYDKKNYLARKLHIIFETKGIEFYLNMVNRIVKNNKGVVLSSEEEKIVIDYEKTLLKDIKELLNDMIIENININDLKFKIGYMKTLYRYRNDIPEIIKEKNEYNIDVVGMIMEDTTTVSYRSINDVDVSVIGNYFGGTGHKGASSHPQNNEKFLRILKKLK